MKKITISKLFLYRYRFVIGYVLLSLAFVGLLFLLPFIAQNGLSQAEMDSAVKSFSLSKDSILNGNLVDLPYYLLQKFSIMLFGFTTFAIKLPSIVVGMMLGLLLVLLLNRWFKSNVSLLASCLVILSTPFLFLAGSGTPLIMLVFWPTLLLWLGSKIQGEKHPKPLYVFAFSLAMLASLFTPYMLYFALVCVGYVISQPHLRFAVKKLPILVLILIFLIIIAGVGAIGFVLYHHPEALMELIFAKDFHLERFSQNIMSGFSVVFSWHSSLESVFLSPLVSLPILAMALIGLFSTTKGFFASRNSIATILIVFCVIITGFEPESVIFIILPLSILVAHGSKYLLEKWYGLFPENPYARVSAILPLSLLFGLMIIPGLLQYIYGYRYNPNIANQFNYNLNIIHENLEQGPLFVNDKFEFYGILNEKSNIRVFNLEEWTEPVVAFLYKPQSVADGYKLSRIITSPMRENSAIIYLYEREGE